MSRSRRYHCPMDDFIGFLSAIVEGVPIGLVIFVALIVGIVWATRRRPGRRYEKRPPSRAEAEMDKWSGPG